MVRHQLITRLLNTNLYNYVFKGWYIHISQIPSRKNNHISKYILWLFVNIKMWSEVISEVLKKNWKQKFQNSLHVTKSWISYCLPWLCSLAISLDPYLATLTARDQGKADSKRSELGLQARDSSHLCLEFFNVTFGSEQLQLLQSQRYNIWP